MNELQKKLDDLLEDCGENYKISGKKIVKVKKPTLKTVLRYSSNYYDTYVGEKGALHQYDDYDSELDKSFVSLIEEHKPEQIEFLMEDDVEATMLFDGEAIDFNLSCLEGQFGHEYMHDVDKYVFNRKDKGEYHFNAKDSGITFDEYEQNSVTALSMIIMKVDRLQRYRSEESFD